MWALKRFKSILTVIIRCFSITYRHCRPFPWKSYSNNTQTNRNNWINLSFMTANNRLIGFVCTLVIIILYIYHFIIRENQKRSRIIKHFPRLFLLVKSIILIENKSKRTNILLVLIITTINIMLIVICFYPFYYRIWVKVQFKTLLVFNHRRQLRRNDTIIFIVQIISNTRVYACVCVC